MTALNKQARQVQRYANFGVDMMEWVDGGYVKYSDYLALLDELEKTQKGEKQWREVVDAFCVDDADWHKLTTSNNELISFLSQALCKQVDRIAELEAEKETLRPVGVMSEGAFRRLENSESRFIALWPRPGIYLPRKRPDDGVIVYARTAAGIGVKGEWAWLS
ncbi:hypothetical protein [Citrobacter sp. FDAARGOS_156]|uniref:hypothetical protein n=1 Tax=Citrobacter sp. FDAARGOS_156 TaxID=1702170 RepID=UPI001F33CC30|nr:hypothetical protein [Citrobacter sp. FDAARGOS_156]